MKVIPSEDVVSQKRTVASDVKIKPCKVKKNNLLFKREGFGNWMNGMCWRSCARLMEITQGWFAKCSG